MYLRNVHSMRRLQGRDSAAGCGFRDDPRSSTSFRTKVSYGKQCIREKTLRKTSQVCLSSGVDFDSGCARTCDRDNCCHECDRRIRGVISCLNSMFGRRWWMDESLAAAKEVVEYHRSVREFRDASPTDSCRNNVLLTYIQKHIVERR